MSSCIWHAYYSNKQAQLGCNILIYRTVDGREVACTEVKDNKTGQNFDDSKYIGEVVQYVRCLREGSENSGVLIYERNC